MKILNDSTNSVIKFVHDDGSETAIKCVASQSTFIDPNTGKVETEFCDRQKWSIFISSSVGCYMKCKFCHLTTKNSEYKKLMATRILSNLKEAVTAAVEQLPHLKDRWVKVCWMGMGDAINVPITVHLVTLDLINWIITSGYAKGIDGVDVSTVLPEVSSDWVDLFADLNRQLSNYNTNPNNAAVEQSQLANHKTYTNRSPLRVFYSIHSAVQSTRDEMVPNATPLSIAIPVLKRVQALGVNVLFHQVFVEGLNSSTEEVDELISWMRTHFPESELRVLRYNKCDKSDYQEWSEIDNAVQTLSTSIAQLKVQESAGSAVSAACGQFLVTKPRKLHLNTTSPHFLLQSC